MHVAFFSPAWPLHKHQNGIITYVHWMKRELESQGHLVSVFTAGVDPASADPNIHPVDRAASLGAVEAVKRYVQHGPSEYRRVFDFGFDIARAVNDVHQKVPIDVVEMEESFGWFADVARLTGLPLVVKLHGPAFLSMVGDELLSRLGRERIEREGRALSKMDTIVAPSEIILRQTLARYELKPRVALRIVNPVVMDDRTPLWDRSTCDPHSVLFVGRFDLRKGGDVILKAFAAAARRNENLELVFVGPDSGVVSQDGTKIHFAEFSKSLLPVELLKRVRFLGAMPNHDIMALRTRSMMTVLGSRWENQGYALLEAMFQGCPVVSTDAGGCSESVIDGVTGLLARSEDPESFARQMLALADDPMRAEALGQAARQHVIHEHSATKVVNSAMEIYRRVMENRSPG